MILNPVIPSFSAQVYLAAAILQVLLDLEQKLAWTSIFFYGYCSVTVVAIHSYLWVDYCLAEKHAYDPSFQLYMNILIIHLNNRILFGGA